MNALYIGRVIVHVHKIVLQILIKKSQYEIKDLQLTIDDYKFISQFFNVTTMCRKEVDIILGSIC